MGSFLDEIGKAVKQTACAVIATNDAVNGFMEGIGVPGASGYADRTRALRRTLCDNDDDTVPTPDPPFQGVQCDCGRYEIRIEGTYTNTFGSTGISFRFPSRKIRGPLSDLSVMPTGNINNDLVATFKCRGIGSSSYPTCGSTLTAQVFENTTSPVESVESFTVVVLEALDGDDCGDPVPPPIPPYIPSPTTINISYENNQQITVSEDVDITVFSPKVNLIGGIFAPVTVAGNTFNLVGTAELSPEFKLNLSPKINIRLGGGNTDDPAPNPDKPIPEPEPDEDEIRVIVGAVVTATSVSDRQDFLPQNDNPDIAIPNLGYIAFYILVNDDAAWTADIPIKNVRSYIPCPVTTGAVDVAGSSRSGVELTIQPVWGYLGQNVSAD